MEDAPPPYSKHPVDNHPAARNGITPAERRSLEDENRPLPSGWVRQFDAKNAHQYFVDTRSDPPRSIWSHPHDDEQYLSTLSSEERERLQAMYREPSRDDIEAELTDEEEHTGPSRTSASQPSKAEVPSSQRPQKQTLGRKMKDRLTNSTHEEREVNRRRREAEERKAYEQHRQMRAAMVRAMETGEPQRIGTDRDGHDLYVEPPRGPSGSQMYGYPGVPNYRGYNPYQHGVYTNPNARFLRPQGAYGRPYGSGYGGGYGLPLAGGLAGGLLFGSVLGMGF